MTKKRQPEGITARHARACPARSSGRCRCTPSYQAQVWSARDGKRVSSFSTLADAKAWRHDALVGLRRGTVRATAETRLHGAAAEWLRGARDGSILNRSGDRYKPSALRGYEQALRDRILPELGGAKLSDIRRSDVQRLVNRMLGAGFNASTIRNALLPLRAIYRHALALDEVAVNPTAGVHLPAVRGTRDRIASPEEASSLFAVLESSDRAIWATAMYAGLRLGELLALDWGDVDLAGGMIRVTRSYDPRAGITVLPKSRAGRRTVPIAAILRDELVEHRMRQGRDVGLVFGRSENQPFGTSTIYDRANRAWAESGLVPISLHECRHTFASLMIAAGVNAKALASFMGHSSVTITLDRYGHLMPGSEEEAAGLLDTYLDRANSQARLAAVGDATG
jgi:integrase